MSAGAPGLQAQVESVLGALVKAAALELTRLLESRYPASAAGRTEDGGADASWGRPDTRRSIGVQVDRDPDPELPDRGRPGQCQRDAAAVEGCLTPSEILQADVHGPGHPEWSPLQEQVLAEAANMLEFSILESESSADGDDQTEVVVHVCAETWADALRDGPTQSSTTKQKPLVIQPDTSDTTCEEKVKFVCPLILKPESAAPKTKNLKKPLRVKPRRTCISTAKGAAYGPPPSDGAVAPFQVGIWERINVPKETKNDLQMKLKLTSPDPKLFRPCAVELVNVLTVPDSEIDLQDHNANCKAGWRLPKDLRPHQGLHTGHRLCCFTPRGNGVWRLKSVVARSRDGYACKICGKTFKHRKLLRRHERFHSGEKPYLCSVCSKTFALRKSLRRHVRFHTGERPHTCSQCGKSFRLRDNLKAHLRSHSGEKPFSCTLCGKMFRIMRNLEKHNLSQCGFFVPSFRTIAGL